MSAHEATLQKALALIAAGKPAQAEEILRRLVQRAPTDLGANHLLGSALLAQQKADAALFFSERASRQPGAGSSVFDVLGSILASKGDHAAAEQAFRRAVELDPGSASAQNGLCASLTFLKKFDEATRAGAAAVRLAPDAPAFVGNYAFALQQSEGIGPTIALLRRSCERWPNEPDLALQLASLLNYDDRVSDDELLAHHRRLGELVSARESSVPRRRRSSRSGCHRPPTAGGDAVFGPA